MLALRSRPLAAFSGPFWLSALCAALAPTSIGYQDLAAFLARQPGISERWRDHLIASPFGTIHAAMFSFSHPIGTAMAEPVGAQTVNFDPRSLDVKVWIGSNGRRWRARRCKSNIRPSTAASKAIACRAAGIGRQSSGPESCAAIAADQCAVVTQPAPPPTPAPVDERSAAEKRRAARRRCCRARCADRRLRYSCRRHVRIGDDVTGSIPPTTPDVAAAPKRDASGKRRSTRHRAGRQAAGNSRRRAKRAIRGGAVAIRLAVFPRRGCGGAQHPDLFRRRRHGCRAADWNDGRRRGAGSGAARSDPDIKLSALEGPPDAGPGGETVAGKDDVSRLDEPGGAARP